VLPSLALSLFLDGPHPGDALRLRSSKGRATLTLGKGFSFEINGSVLPNNGQRLARIGQNRG
jgi:hypothetical protein